MVNNSPDPATVGTATHVELADLRRILREAAGAEQGVDLDGDIIDTSFEELGYDSIAVMETASSICRRYGVTIGDEALFEAKTPRALLELVNRETQRPTGAVRR